MAKYHECPLCGSHLDHGERCDCEQVRVEKEKRLADIFQLSSDGQMIKFTEEGMI